MKRNLLVLLLLLCCGAGFTQTRKYLNAGWTFNESGKKVVMGAVVPGCVQADLLRLNKIPDPFIGLNEEKIRWVEDTSWEYHRKIEITPELLKNQEIFLVFEGLDTYAAIFLNGRQLLETDNMFRTYRLDIKKSLKLGSNTLTVKFASVTARATPLAIASKIKYPADNEQGTLKISPFVRKAPFQFGWDFAPKLLTAGIWRPVYLEYATRVAFNDVQVIVKQFNEKRASCVATANVSVKKTGNYLLTITDQADQRVLWETTINLKPGITAIAQPFTLPHPKIWWPNGMGSQYTYRLGIKLTSADGFKLEKIAHFGVRSIEVINKPDSIGQSFYLQVNGKPVFVKGANFVPVSSLHQQENSVKLRRLFKDMVESNFNMIRVWGGGYYESEEFYKLADENGIMVWQDFPFACTMYPSDAQFLANVAQEAEDNIKRIRNHPSLALWCGNNEIAVGWKNWGWQKTYNYSKADSIELINGYDKLFKDLLPGLVAKYDPARFYFHSSPISNWGKPEDFKSGDNHYWGVYHGEEPFSAYQTHVPRFNSEFGFQSFPSWGTLQQIAQTNAPALESEILTKRQKSYKGNKLLSKYMSWYYQPPANDQQFVYLSQLQQAEGMKIAIEASRSAMPYNMGTLVWQFNDVWPAISWSAINYDGQWKAAQYFIRKAYSPTLLTVRQEQDVLDVAVVSDHQNNDETRLMVEVWNINGLIKRIDPITVSLSGNQATHLKISFKSLGIKDASTEFMTIKLVDNERVLTENIHYFNPVKDLKLPAAVVTCKLAKEGGKRYLTLSSQQLVKNVYLDIIGSSAFHFEDNYFDMLPGKNYKVLLETKLTETYIRSNLKISAVNVP